MTTRCETIRPQLGAFADGELLHDQREQVGTHLTACPSCRQELSQLETLASRIANTKRSTAPAGLWPAVEASLDQSAGATTSDKARPTTVAKPWFRRLTRTPLAAAAILLLIVGLGWLATNTPWATPAMAAQIDFRPLLERADGDIGAGIHALMQTYGGEAISADHADQHMTVRVRAPERLPGSMRLQGRYLLNMGRSHQALAFYYTGPDEEHLLLLQCPPGVRKDYGNFECVACSVGDRQGHGVQVGKLHLLHMASENVCVCVVSTLNERALELALNDVAISF